MNYGIPYMGSKSRIAKWVIDTLPSGDIFVDLFAGGCAVTHAAVLSGKYKHIIANDIGDGPEIFMAAIKGEFDGYSKVATREEFMNTDDPVIKLLYSFGNDQSGYAYSKEIEPIKIMAQKMLSAPSIYERRINYRQFIHCLSEYLKNSEDKLESLKNLPSLEALNRMQSLEGLVSDIKVSRHSYQLCEIPEGAVVYCDPPYKRSNCSKYYTGQAFDYDAFEEWLSYVPFQVFVSEYDSPRGCIQIAQKERMLSMAPTKTNTAIEKIFTQRRFVDGQGKQ